MNVLILTPGLPYPAHQGGALRNLGLLQGMAQAGHIVTLMSFADTDTPDTTPLHTWCSQVYTFTLPQRSPATRIRDVLLTGHADLARRLESPAFRSRLASVLLSQHFDLVQFEGLEMAIYMQQVRNAQPAANLIYDAHNAESALQQIIADVAIGRPIAAGSRAISSPGKIAGTVYSRIQARRIATFERAACLAADGVIAVSEEDAAALRPFRLHGDVHVLPNGIFTDDYTTVSPLELGTEVLVFTGKMDYRPNVDAMHWFVGNILPRITGRRPNAKLYIVGQKPHHSLTGLADTGHVEVTGWVAQVQPFLAAAAVYIAPLRMGSGTRLKILEAMATGRAVVATRAAAAGLSAQAQAALVLADDETGFAQAVLDLLGDPARRVTLGAQARAVVTAQYDWKALTPCLHTIHQTIRQAADHARR